MEQFLERFGGGRGEAVIKLETFFLGKGAGRPVWLHMWLSQQDSSATGAINNLFNTFVCVSHKVSLSRSEGGKLERDERKTKRGGRVNDNGRRGGERE